MAKTPEQLKEWLEKQEERRKNKIKVDARKQYLMLIAYGGKFFDEWFSLSAEALSYGKEFYDEYKIACDKYCAAMEEHFRVSAEEKMNQLQESSGEEKLKHKKQNPRPWWQVLRDLIK